MKIECYTCETIIAEGQYNLSNSILLELIKDHCINSPHDICDTSEGTFMIWDGSLFEQVW